MMRGLWSAASGMKAQQLNIDNISNNLANVNTTGYKKMRVEFKDLLYENIKQSNLSEEGEGSPVNLQVGHGVMYSATSRNFENGSFESTNNPTDLALDGGGFFKVYNPATDENFYTRDGSFKLSVDGDTRKLVTSEGYSVLTDDGGEIVLEDGQTDFTVDESGRVTVKTADGETEEIGTIAIYDFLNPDGLQAVGSNLYKADEKVTGVAIPQESDDIKTKVRQGYLEASNVQIVEEMIKLITAQRAYDINSKAIQTADEMMQTANNVKR